MKNYILICLLIPVTWLHSQLLPRNSFFAVKAGSKIELNKEALNDTLGLNPWSYSEFSQHYISLILQLPFNGQRRNEIEKGLSSTQWRRRLGFWLRPQYFFRLNSGRPSRTDLDLGISLRERIKGFDFGAGIATSYEAQFGGGLAGYAAYYKPFLGRTYLNFFFEGRAWIYQDLTNVGTSDTYALIEFNPIVKDFGEDTFEPFYKVGAGLFYSNVRGTGFKFRYYSEKKFYVDLNYNALISQTKIREHVFSVDILLYFIGSRKTKFSNVLLPTRADDKRRIECPDHHLDINKRPSRSDYKN